jgi:hypothetical protein
MNEIPESSAALAEYSNDVTLFETNPNLLGFIRRPYPGEAPPKPAPAGHSLAAVFVRSVLPGIRTRRAIYRRTPEATQ